MISIPSSLGFGDRLPNMPSLPSFNLATLPSFSSSVLGESSPAPQATPPPPQTPGSVESDMSSPDVLTQPNTPTTQTIPVQQMSALTEVSAQQYDVASWLTNLGLQAYTDNFHKQGIYYMYQLQDFGLEDLEKMKIGMQHRNQIWRSMVELRNIGTMQGNASPTPPTNTTEGAMKDLISQGSSASTVSLATQQNNGYNPGFYEVTRYTFKHTISLKKEDHDYC